MLISTPGTSVSTGVSTGLIGTFDCAASLLLQNVSKSSGRGVDSPIFVGATAAPTAYSPLFRPVFPPTNFGGAPPAGAAEPAESGAAVVSVRLAYGSIAT